MVRRGNAARKGRLSELAIEQLFGRLRTQSSSAQLTSRSYWKACCRDMMRSLQSRKLSKMRMHNPEGEEPISPDGFFHASQRAMRASMKLAAFCAGVTEESLHHTYEEWCQAKGYAQTFDPLGDENEFDDSLEGVQEEDAADEKANEKATQEFFSHMQAEAAMEDELPASATDPKIVDTRLDTVPDKELLTEILNAKPDKGEEPEVPKESPTKGACSPGMACSLHKALWCLGADPSEQDVFDSVFRLVAYLRHWQGGSDRCWIRDPRASRRRSTKLNWYQSGHVVIALLPVDGNGDGGRVPRVCLVLSIWTCQRKPKLSTQPVGLTHCVAIRVVELTKMDGSHQSYACDGQSRAWVLKPQGVVAVLAVESLRNELQSCSLTLTDGSFALVSRTGSVQEWWPDMEDSPAPASGQPAKAQRYKHLFVRGHGQKRRKLALNKVAAKAKAKAASKEKSKKKTTKSTLKKAKKAPEHVPEVLANYKKQPGSAGSALIVQQMNKAKKLDDAKFATNLLFNADTGCCRLTFEDCKGVQWSVVLEAAHDYFRTVFLARIIIIYHYHSLSFIIVLDWGCLEVVVSCNLLYFIVISCCFILVRDSQSMSKES
eukprot:Skav224604  [mRNA]  locus=scaffold2684:382216:385435:- [translate_table: standard]